MFTIEYVNLTTGEVVFGPKDACRHAHTQAVKWLQAGHDVQVDMKDMSGKVVDSALWQH